MHGMKDVGKRYLVCRYVPDEELEECLNSYHDNGYEVVNMFRMKTIDSTTLIGRLIDDA